MDFTREPIIETIITPKEGHKLVVRSSTSAGQEEYFVDAVEIVAFGQAQFFRSLERPKAFLVPVSDYEILEVREARMVLKNAGLDRSIKIGGGREGALKTPREVEKEIPAEAEAEAEEAGQEMEAPVGEARPDAKVDKKRDRRRHYRKRRGRDEKEEGAQPAIPPLEDEKVAIQPPEPGLERSPEEAAPLSPSVLSSLLQPPPTLISETINRYRENEMFKGAFYLTEEEEYKPHDKVQELLNEEDEDEEAPALQEPMFDPKEAETDNGKEREPALEEPHPYSFESEEDTILHSRLPLYPEEELDAAELLSESPYEPTELPAVENETNPTTEK